MLKLFHISDLHFGEVYVPKVGQAVRRLANRLDLDVIVASGDFTQHAREEEFVAAREFLASLPDVPLVVTPGNHDIPPRWQFRDFWTPFALYRKHIHTELDYAVSLEDIQIVSLNSTSWLGSLVPGRLTSQQLRFCESRFQDGTPEQVRVVVIHHHIAPAPGWNGGGEMGNAKRTLQHLTDLKVDMILAGHKHRAYIGNSLDFYSGDRSHGITFVQCGTTTSRRGRGAEREKNTLNVITVDEDILAVTHYMYFSEVDDFRVTGKHLFPRSLQGPLGQPAGEEGLEKQR
ncbi:MAG: metallophosphoesterase family protein [Gemmataceae bacterium]